MSEVKVKGTGLISTRTYIKEKHGEDYDKWLEQLPIESRELYKGVIPTTNWFPIKEAYYYPLKTVADLFFDGDIKKAGLDVGRFSADYGLKGVYKVFLMIATPQALMRASKRIIALYYKGVDVEIYDIQKKSLVLSATKVCETDTDLDYRTIGWCVRALELANCKNVKYENVDSADSSKFAIKLSWD